MLLIDGNSMLFRGFYATYYTQMMKTSTGIPTNAVFAFANMLNKAIDMIHPEYCLVAFDKAKHTFRHDLNPDYKGTRKSAPEELVPQFALVREYLDAYHIPFLEYDNFEADDIIGSVSKKYPHVEIAILTSDRDMLQLIDDTTTVFLMKKGMSDIRAMNASTLLDEFGVTPPQIIDLKALMGDTADNIKGVPGIGEKTATKLVQTYGSVDNLYEHIDDLKGKQKEKLIDGKDSCFLSKTLATIKTDVTIDKELDEFVMNLDADGVNDFYDKYEMFSLKKRKKPTNKSLDIKRVSKISDNLLVDKTFIYLDSDYFTYYNPKIYGLVFANNHDVEYIPFEDFIDDKAAQSYLSSDKLKITFDLKFLLHAFKANGFEMVKNFDDLMLMAFLKNNYDDELAKILLSYGKEAVVDIEEVYGTIKKPKMVDTIIQTKRAASIATSCLEIYDVVLNGLKQDEEYELYKNIELPLTYVLYEMEEEGVICKEAVLDEIAQDMQAKLDEISKAVFELAGHEFNINSPKQLAEVLFDEIGLPMNKKRSTSADELEKIRDYHPVITEILKYRKYSKILSTYAEGLKKYIASDGKIHTIFSQTITATGRLSSYEPNLQNISVRDEEGRNIRKAFEASEDHVLISSDYSQIELRVIASLAKEQKMIDAFNNGIDIHTSTAMHVFGLSHDEVDANMRRKAKAVNFGVVYGISDFGLSQQANISVAEARHFISEYFKNYPNIKNFLDESIKFCEENGYVKTMMNRRRYINEIKDSNYMRKEFGKRAAMNARIQGSAADLIKIAMIKINAEIKKRGLKSRMVLQIHDELIFDVLNSEKDEMIELIKEGMKNAYPLDVRLDSSLSVARTWYDAK